MRRGTAYFVATATTVSASLASSHAVQKTSCSSTTPASEPPKHADLAEVERAGPGAPSFFSSGLSAAPPPRLRLVVVRPDLVDDWLPELNDANVQTVECRSTELYWWRCSRCHTSYQASVRARVAMGAACCPHCRGHGTTSATPPPQASGNLDENKDHDTEGSSMPLSETPDVVRGSLAETHPSLAACWDTERNGLLRPTEVTADSTVSVWWRPISSVNHTAITPPRTARSFRRAVFAFVSDPASVDEKLAAEARLEEDLLSKIHDAARVEEAGRHATSLPASVFSYSDATIAKRLFNTSPPAFAKTEPQPSQTAPEATTTLASGASLRGNDRTRAVELWRQRAERLLAQQQQEERQDTQRNADGEAHVAATRQHASAPRVRRYFHFSSANVNPVAAAAITRDEMLRGYMDFIRTRQLTRHPTSSNADAGAQDTNGEASVADLDKFLTAPHGGVALNPHAWLSHVTLTAEDVKPTVIAAPSDQAVLSFAATSSLGTRSSRQTAGSRLPAPHRKSMPPLPPSSARDPEQEGSRRGTHGNNDAAHGGYTSAAAGQSSSHRRPGAAHHSGGEKEGAARRDAASSVTTPMTRNYPRRPPRMPPAREDNVVEATPPAEGLSPSAASSSPVHAPHISAAGSNSGPFNKRPLLWAAEAPLDLEVSIRSEALEASADASNHSTEAAAAAGSPVRRSLLSDAVAALGHAAVVSEEEKHALQYARERPERADKTGSGGAPSPRRTGQRPRRFRLQFPASADSTDDAAAAHAASSSLSVTDASTGTHTSVGADGRSAAEAAPSPAFEAPRAPRKVARPRRASTPTKTSAASV